MIIESAKAIHTIKTANRITIELQSHRVKQISHLEKFSQTP